jgi:hypothetical protein
MLLKAKEGSSMPTEMSMKAISLMEKLMVAGFLRGPMAMFTMESGEKISLTATAQKPGKTELNMKVPLSEARRRAKERLAGQTNAVLRVTGSTIRCTD